MTSRLLPVCATLSLVWVSACGKSTTPATSPAADSITCQNDPRVSPYAANLSVTSAGSTFKLVLKSADPAPPARDLNSWTLEVQDMSGNPLSGATINNIKPWMPDHGHGATVVPSVTMNGAQASIANLDFFMAGVWQITFTVTLAGATAPDTAVYTFCVPG